MKMTNKELKELGISRELWKEWQSVMNCMWKFCQQCTTARPVNGDNEILIGSLTIKCHWVNAKYTEVVIRTDKTVLLTLRTPKNLKALELILGAILVDNGIN